VTDVDGDDRRRAPLEQAVGEPSGRRPGVEAAQPGGIDAEPVEGTGQLEAAPGDVWERVGPELDRLRVVDLAGR